MFPACLPASITPYHSADKRLLRRSTERLRGRGGGGAPGRERVRTAGLGAGAGRRNPVAAWFVTMCACVRVVRVYVPKGRPCDCAQCGVHAPDHVHTRVQSLPTPQRWVRLRQARPSQCHSRVGAVPQGPPQPSLAVTVNYASPRNHVSQERPCPHPRPLNCLPC